MKKYEILKKLVSFNTIKDKENKEIIDYIENYLKSLNFKTEYKGKYLIMSIGNAAKLGFLGHTDTVEYIDGWETNPFELTNKNNNLYGLGTCDMKGGIAAMLDAVAKVDFNKMKYGMKLYFTYDEEIGFKGMYDIVNSGEIFPEITIFGEPTNNEILIGSKGLLEIELDFKGIKAHSSNPEKGKSANLNAVNFLVELQDFYNIQIKPYKVEKFEIPYTTMNVGIINGGSAKNSIPANCNVCIDFRIVKSEHIDFINKKLKELSLKYDCDLKIIESIDPFINEIDFVEEVKTANFLTEASLVKQSKNENNQACKKIILGTGPVTAHEINEYITVESYDKLVEQYKNLISKICK